MNRQRGIARQDIRAEIRGRRTAVYDNILFLYRGYPAIELTAHRVGSRFRIRVGKGEIRAVIGGAVAVDIPEPAVPVLGRDAAHVTGKCHGQGGGSTGHVC